MGCYDFMLFFLAVCVAESGGGDETPSEVEGW